MVIDCPIEYSDRSHSPCNGRSRSQAPRRQAPPVPEVMPADRQQFCCLSQNARFWFSDRRRARSPTEPCPSPIHLSNDFCIHPGLVDFLARIPIDFPVSVVILAQIGLACHHPVKQVPDGRQTQLDGRHGMAPAEFFNPGRHMHGLDGGEDGHAATGAPAQKIPGRACIRFAGVRVADVGGEEF